MNHPDNILSAPFARILPCVVLGIVAGNTMHIPLLVPLVALVVCLVCGWLLRERSIGSLYAALALLFFAMSMTYARQTQDRMPKGERVVMTMQIINEPDVSGRWQKCDARVGKYRYAAENDAEPAGLEWKKSGEKVVLRVDTAHSVSAGQKLVSMGRVGELGSDDYAGYVRLMRRRGFSATVWITPGDSIIALPGKARTPSSLAASMQRKASERLARLKLSPQQAQVAAAMSIGTKGSLDRGVRENYSLSGASHLLAVSGLHVGIVVMLINLLLYFLPAFRRGHLLKNIIAIIVIWLYAMLTGLSPSVVRAAMMFSGLQLSMAASYPPAKMNTLLGTATIMLLINPNYLYDISFQLSFIAVAGIFAMYGPVFGLVRSRFRVVNALWSLFIIGAVATLATAPLVSYYFGRIPVIGILLNPIVIVTANITVLFSLLWILFPVGMLNGIFSTVIGFSTGLQNLTVQFGASLGWGSVDVRLSAGQVILVYIAALVVWVLARYQLSSSKERPKLV